MYVINIAIKIEITIAMMLIVAPHKVEREMLTEKNNTNVVISAANPKLFPFFFNTFRKMI